MDPGSYQVMRLESELVKPIPEIGLALEHIAIDYDLVQFRTQQIQIWLPRGAELYVDRKGHRYYRKHTFTDFRIFNVDTAQSVERPKESYSFTNLSDRDIAGVLAVLPADRAKHEEVKLTFTVPAYGQSGQGGGSREGRGPTHSRSGIGNVHAQRGGRRDQGGCGSWERNNPGSSLGEHGATVALLLNQPSPI